jgi:hypothetical protein
MLNDWTSIIYDIIRHLRPESPPNSSRWQALWPLLGLLVGLQLKAKLQRQAHVDRTQTTSKVLVQKSSCFGRKQTDPPKLCTPIFLTQDS